MMERVQPPTRPIVSYFRSSINNRLCLHQSVRLLSNKWKCTKCFGQFKVGDLDITDRKYSFTCSNCVPKFFHSILDTAFVLKHYTTEALALYEQVVLQRKHISMNMHFLFGQHWRNNNDFMWHKNRAVFVFQRICYLAKLAMDRLSLCLMRLGLYKDLRQLIVKLIWPNEIICWSQEE